MAVAPMLHFRVNHRHASEVIEHDGGPIEVGRGPGRDPVRRCVLSDPYLSKDHLRIEERPGGRVSIDNLSQKPGIRLTGLHAERRLEEGCSDECPFPVRIHVGKTLIELK